MAFLATQLARQSLIPQSSYAQGSNRRTPGEIALIVLIFLCLAVVIGVIVYFIIESGKSPIGGTFADKAVATGTLRGPNSFRAEKVTTQTCEQYKNKDGNGEAFWSADGNACYTCPSGYLVNAFGDMNKNKCTNPKKTIFDSSRDTGATYQRPGIGPAGLTKPNTAIGEFLIGDQIWKCPSYKIINANGQEQIVKTIRNPNANINGPNACVAKCEDLYPKRRVIGSTETTASFNKKFGPDPERKDLNDFLEPVPPSGQQVAFYDIGKTNCWSCPLNFTRSWAPVDATNACSQ